MRPISVLFAVGLTGLMWTFSRDAASQQQVVVTPAPKSPFVAGFDRFAPHGQIDEVTAGRLLISELSCVACHASNDASLKPKGGPRLDRAGAMLQTGWIEDFLAEPHASKPGTTMPNVLGALDPEQQSEAIQSLAAYLGSLRKPFPELKATGAFPVPLEFWDRGDASVGRELYHQVGCVACHAPDAEYTDTVNSDSPIDNLIDQLDAEELEAMGLGAAARRVESIPHSDLTRKYTRYGLTMFLLDPLQVRAGGRMPNMKLLPVEAAGIASYLLSTGELANAPEQDTTKPEQQPEQDRQRQELINLGRSWFAKLNCSECHDRGETFDVEPDFIALSKLDLSREHRCLSTQQDWILDYNLDPLQRSSILSAIAATHSSDSTRQLGELQLSMLQMNCFACHQRDGLGGVGRYRKGYFQTVGGVDLGDEGRLPPSLTGAGKKLQPSWFKKVLLGNKADIRPHQQIRMPKFHPEIAAWIPPRMAKVDKASGATESDLFGDSSKLADAGRQLMDVGCVQCHPFRGYSLPGIVGVDLQKIANRVRPEWFHDFILDPGSLKERTRMPTFFPDGKSQLATLLDGDSERQVAAIWSYLKQLDRQPLPEKIFAAKSQNYELKPEDQPILLRTFMPVTGTHAIAVGFPQGTHIAFDADRLRLAIAWRGRFLDAQGTWFIRSAPPAVPLGDDVIDLQRFPAFAWRDSQPSAWPENLAEYRFGGFRLDQAGVPTFLYRFGDLEIEDRTIPTENARLRRTIVLKSSREPTAAKTETSRLWLAVNEGKQVQSTASGTSVNDQGLRVSVAGAADDQGKLFEKDETVLWAVPVNVRDVTTLELSYQW